MWLDKLAVISALILTPIAGAVAEQLTCDGFPYLDDTLSKDQRGKMLVEHGGICLREGKPLRSVSLFSELIGLEPDNMEAYLRRGVAYVQSGQTDLAIADFSHVISRTPEIVEAWYDRGAAFAARGQYEQAISDLTESIRLEPQFAQALCTRGFALLRKGDYDRALADLSTGIRQDPNVALCYYARGEVLFIKADYRKAVDDFTRGLRLKANVEGLTKRGEAYERLGNKEKALSDFRAALQLAPSFQRAREGINRLSEADRRDQD